MLEYYVYLMQISFLAEVLFE